MKGRAEPMETYTLRRRKPRNPPPHAMMQPPLPRNDSTDVLSSPSNNQNFFSLHRKPHPHDGGQNRFWKRNRSKMLGKFSASSKFSYLTLLDKIILELSILLWNK